MRDRHEPAVRIRDHDLRSERPSARCIAASPTDSPPASTPLTRTRSERGSAFSVSPISCDDSPSKHATAHANASGHPVIQGFEPGEDWFWNYGTSKLFASDPELAAPLSHPADRPVPGPADRAPAGCSQAVSSTERRIDAPRPLAARKRGN